jgi:SAM-dependent methyltransferase
MTPSVTRVNPMGTTPLRVRIDSNCEPYHAMDKTEIRHQWEMISETYAQRRDPDGSDADLVEELLERLPPDPQVLDIGPGDGARTLANLPAGSIGVDISRRGLELATETVPDAVLIQGDMTHLPLLAGTVGGITAYHAVFHVPRTEHPTVYREFARVLRPGGWLLLTLPGSRFETIRENWMGGSMLFSAPGREATLNQLREAGFRNVQTRLATDPLGSSTEFAFAQLDS